MKIKTGDKVRVLAGKDKGKEGKVIQVFPKHDRIVVEGVNMAKRHLRGGQERKGQIIEYASPLHISNVALLSSKTGKTGRVGYKTVKKENEKSKKIRVLRLGGTQEDID
jgi:large subunit ribosomal protein L24